ncbi:hypothetical protein THRCLA_09799 [Thraustotheca clavata]|uniref:F-box domain-containing protein n=1 Tax=Thraustotheca clavata TaxID=74557 RepID=A0A1V9YUR8_9STRA|nr:hypothetical protein THRCLA_09799 [Thraustotheca clavata]
MSLSTFLSNAMASMYMSSRSKEIMVSEKTRELTTAGFLMGQGLTTELAAILLQYLDAASICRLQRTCRMWRQEILAMDSSLWTKLIKMYFGMELPVAAMPTALSYVMLTQEEARIELTHTSSLVKEYSAFEEYRRTERDNGIIAMFCDICMFENQQIAQAIAKQRYGALPMVIVETPQSVIKFRKLSHHVGQINFVPLENPLWPALELPNVDESTPGFINYAFNLAKITPGYEHLQDNVVRTILKNIMVFTTRAHAQRYMNSIGIHVPTVALDDSGAPYSLCFSNPLRQRLQNLRLAEREKYIKDHILAMEQSISAMKQRQQTTIR